MSLDSAPAPLSNSLDRVWDALDRGGWKPNRRANTFKALCPIHGDANPSLSVKYDPSDGKVALHCFGCNAHVADITAAIGLGVSDLFDAPLPDNYRNRGNREPRRKRPALPTRLTRDDAAPKTPDLTGATWSKVKVYEYVDEDGTALQQVHREETNLDGKRHKRFTQRYRGNSGRWVKRKPEGFAPLLYNLPSVVSAAAAGGDIWLLEGEKDVDNAVNEGLVATTNSGGANTFPSELIARFQGAHVRLVVDNDLAGYQRAASLTEQFRDSGLEVTTYLPAPTEAKADFTDHLDAGGTIADLVEISLEDAQALSAAGESDRLITRVEICKREAVATLEAKQQDRATSEQHAEQWARESVNRLDRITTLAPAEGIDYSTRGREAAAAFRRTLTNAAQISADTFTAAGLKTPSQVSALLPANDEEALAEPVETPTAETAAGEGDDGAGIISLRGDLKEEDDPYIIATEYAVVNGITVRVQREKVGDEWRKKYHRIMGGWGEVLSESVEDDGTDSEVARPAHTITVRFRRPRLTRRGRPFRDPESGEIQADTATVKFSDEQVRDGSWARALPWPDFLESTTRNALTTAWSAIYRAYPTIKAKSTVYTTVGWRQNEDVATFVHAGGAITADGTRNVDVDAAAPYEVCDLPEPTTDREALRAAWLEGTIELKESGLMQRVLAPLLGHSWGAVLTPSDMLMHLAGGRASFKSAHARVACQYFAPKLHFRGTKEMLSGANQGTTTIGLIRALNGASHIPVLVDDFAPDGDAKRAQKKLSELARTVFNGIGRITGKQRGGIKVDRPIEASIITTGELTATGSGDTRIVNLPLDPRSTDNGRALFARLESRRHRAARGLLGSTLLQWVASHRTELLAELEESEDSDTDSKFNSEAFWEKQLATLPHDAGLLGRLINAAVTLDRGISLMLRMLRDHDAITAEEAREFYTWAREGIYAAVCLQDASAGDPAESLLDYLREAIASRKVHITMDDGTHPPQPDMFGWTWQGGTDFGQWRPSGERIGAIKGDRLYLLPTQSIATANLMATRADETFSETPVSIGSALVAHGWVKRNSRGEAATAKRFGGQQVRVWDIPLSVLVDANDDGDTDSTNNLDSPDQDLPPALFEAPSDPATEVEQSEDAPGPAEDPHDDGGETATVAEASVDEAPEAAQPPQVAEPEPPATAAGKQPRSAPLPQFRASVAVLHTDGVWLPDGEHFRIDEPIEHIGQLALLASRLRLGTQINSGANRLRKTERGQIYVTREAAIDLGVPFDTLPPATAFRYLEKLRTATPDHPFIVEARQAGFQVSGKDTISPSVECWRDDNRDVGVLVSFLPAQHIVFHDTILDADPTPVDIARRLQKFTDATRFPYRKNPSSTGLDFMIALHPKHDRDRVFAPMNTPQVVKDAGFRETDYDWQRTLTEKEQEHSWVHAFDRGGSYLAAVAGIDLPIGHPTHYPEGVAFTAETKLPGYWKVTAPEKGPWTLPDPVAPLGRSGPAIPGSIMWITTPTMELAHELDLELEIHEAYLWHDKGRIFGTWQQRVRDARDVLDTSDPDDHRARELLKSAYVSGLGIMGSEDYRSGKIGFSPARYHHIMAKSRANIFRRVNRIGLDTGHWPVAIKKDTVVYTADTPEPTDAWPGEQKTYGRKLGQYKYEGSAPLSDHLEYFTGEGPYKGKDNLEELI
ncbi:MAG: CHC2 zinc finger domain-containing protein [Microbacterium sp.]